MHRDEKERKAKAIETSVRASSIGGLTWLHPSHCGRLTFGVLLLCAQKMACKSGKSAKRAVENATIAKTAEMQKSAEMQKIADQQKMEKATELMLVREAAWRR